MTLENILFILALGVLGFILALWILVPEIPQLTDGD